MGSRRNRNKLFGDSDHGRDYYFTELCCKGKEEKWGLVAPEENGRSKGACSKMRLQHAGMGMVQREREMMMPERKSGKLGLAESRELVCSNRNEVTGRWVWYKGGSLWQFSLLMPLFFSGE